MNETLLSHQTKPENIESTIKKIKHRIKTTGNKPHVTVKKQLNLVDALAQFELGQFLLQHQGVNGFWTDYVLTHPWRKRKTDLNAAQQPLSDLETTILDTFPVIRATQQRFQYFLQQNQTVVKNGHTLASIPCGVMGELLYLNYDGITNIELIGIDLDENALQQAQKSAQKYQLDQWVQLKQKNAWDLHEKNRFDLISSNGLNIYEPDDAKLMALHQIFYNALKTGGKLVTSFLTYPPSVPEKCEWLMHKINPESALLQRILFSDILDTKFQCYRTSELIRDQLALVGFKHIQFIWDEAQIFPTVVAIK